MQSHDHHPNKVSELPVDPLQRPACLRNRSYQCDFYRKISGIIQLYYSKLNAKTYRDTLRDIEHNLKQNDIHFEKKQLPVSIQPTLIVEDELSVISETGSMIRNILNNLLNDFVSSHHKGEYDSPLHLLFAPYYRYWDIIANESRKNDPIQLMRFDTIREPDGSWKFLENNTACPGGVIHCSYIRNAWLMTPFGWSISKGENIQTYPIDHNDSFIKFMVDVAEKSFPSSEINLAVCNYQGTYTNELSTLQRIHTALEKNGDIPPGQLIICDIQELEVHQDQAYYKEIPIHLIYNKLDPLMIEPHTPKISGWLHAARCSKTEFLNSIGAMYLSEAKRSLVLLSDPQFRKRLDISKKQDKILDTVIPYTRFLPTLPPKTEYDENFLYILKNQKNQFVIKADALTRGEGIYLGQQCTNEEWLKGIAHIKKKNGICQLCCQTPFRDNLQFDEKGIAHPYDEYYGIDLFYFGKKFAGPVSRTHTNKVFNVGNGGKETPVLVLK